MALPANVGHGTVTGRFIDSSGANIEGRVTFSPTPRRLLNATAEPSPVTILPKAVDVTLNDGSFTQALLATDDPDNNPVGWNYRVDFKFTGAAAESFNIEVPEGASIDLTTVTPVGSGNGTTILRGPGVPDWSEAEDGQVVVLVDGEPAWGDGGSGGVSSWNDLTDKPSTFTPATHTHPDLSAAIDAKANTGHGHTVADVTGLQASLDAKAATSHTHTVANVTGLQAALDGKQAAGSYAAATHTHAVANVTGLQAALDGKQAAGSYAAATHTHATGQVTGLDAALAAKADATATTSALAAKAPAHWVGTQAEYDALVTKDADRLYLIREA